MSGRQSAALPAAISGGAVLLAAAAWFLRDEAPAPPPPPVEDPAPVPPAPATAAAPSATSPGPPPAVVLPPKVPAGAKPYAVLRLVDAVTRAPVRWSAHAGVFLVPATSADLALPEPAEPAEDGSVRVFAALRKGEGLPGVLGPGEIERGRYVIAVPGYLRAEFARRADIEGEREIALRPSPVSVRGVLVAGRGVTGQAVLCGILQDPRRGAVLFRPPVPVPPSAFGPFAVHDLPEGKWVLMASARLPDGTQAVATREFEVKGETADLGEIVLRPPVTVRARVVAKDGTAILDPGLRVEIGAERPEGKEEEDGWVRFRGLEAGAEVRVTSSLPDLAQEIRLPPEGGEEVRVELRWEEEGVRCRLRFTVGGLPPTRWGEIFEGPTLDKGAWKKDGFLEHEMAPGEYLFGIWAEPSGKSGMTRVWAKFTVPRQPGWEADIACSEEQPK